MIFFFSLRQQACFPAHLLLYMSLAVAAFAAEPRPALGRSTASTREAHRSMCRTRRSKSPRPLVFVWHGHGGTAQAMVRRYQLEKVVRRAIRVYPQGLNTPGRSPIPKAVAPAGNIRPAIWTTVTFNSSTRCSPT